MRQIKVLFIGSTLLAGLLAAGCGQQEAPPMPPAPAEYGKEGAPPTPTRAPAPPPPPAGYKPK